MQFAGVTPEDASDPRERVRALLARMPVPYVGFVAQRHLEDPVPGGINSSSDRTGLDGMEVSLSYTLLRNPDDRDAPENLVELDDETWLALEPSPGWPRPDWVAEVADRMRFPQLWETVRTTWHQDVDPELSGVDAVLRAHIDHVLRNRFTEVTGWSGRFGDPVPPGDITPASIQRGVPLRLDGVDHDGIMIDTDPFVYGMGAQLDRHTVVTAVVPRDVLGLIVLEFASQFTGR